MYTAEQIASASKVLDLINQMGVGKQKGLNSEYKFAVGTPVNPYYNGPGGLFGVSGLEQDFISTRVQPVGGLGSRLPAFPDAKAHPLFAYLTGFLDVTGSHPTNVCDAPQVAGPGKSCIQTAQFGRYSYETREVELNRIGLVNDRGEFMDYNVVNDPLVGDLGGGLFPNIPAQDQMLRGRELVARMIEVGVAFQNTLVRQLYTGNPANNTAGGGWREFPGLDLLIGTTKVDALTNIACPSLASDIKNFNYGRVDATNLNPDIVQVMSYMYRYLRRNAESMGFNPTKWVIAMRNDLFYELTAVWPCSYLTYRCQFRVADGTVITNVSAADQIAMRDAMRAGRYLIIDGDQVEVVIDDGIIEHNRSGNAAIGIGCFSSDIYFVPMTVRGNYPVTFWQFFDYNQGPMTAVRDGRLQNFWTDGGRYMWVSEYTRWCVLLTAKIEPRVILRTPHLAGRITNVQYCPLQHTRDALPTDYYFTDGGVSTPRAAPSYYTEWGGTMAR